MNPKKPDRLRAKSAGISLEPDLIQKLRVHAAKEGFNTLSALARHVLTKLLEQGPDEIGEGKDLSPQDNAPAAKRDLAPGSMGLRRQRHSRHRL